MAPARRSDAADRRAQGGPAMTFCVVLRVREGVVALADTQVVRGDERSSKAKLSMLRHGGGTAFVMTSGLRSIRDKVVLRLEDELATMAQPHRRMHELVTAYGQQLRRVRREDSADLAAGGLSFNTHTIIGGRLAGDSEPEVFLVYPEGNWITATPDLPYFMIGRTSYGKPILDRLATGSTPLRQAIALAYLAFDATQASVVDVDFPIDVVTMTSAGRVRQRRYVTGDLAEAHDYWRDRLAEALGAIPMGWAAELESDAAPQTVPEIESEFVPQSDPVAGRGAPR
jgi:putative proteasome-type protease